ncbi:uncharacterized protein NFIA_093240 [Aspergillus fischeri NRRL 181]|uniref:Rhodopsin domain-containing protein n=1 Tax=Neosartorya fischeri (strain ATCC 1020 / DSM 3700 / CBS 544.65 / FGSC A1164 / JCM 1740 / NRRL 181 / WB 181) TaxID=331117 RepID=A1DJ04_NEOFI|nr:conserved hypothetical protein [Aspergillus fischeri NRRL 181]EAW19361.1 conserved hypothetical protein [Aspergillus fischeri NRRL 181]
MATAYGGRGPVLLGVTWAETALALILFGLRAKTASLCPPEDVSFGFCGLRWDFIWVMFAYALAFAAQCTMTVSVSYGLGLHQDQLSHQQIVASNYWSWIAQVLAILDLAIARCAVIAFLLALQMHTHRKGRWALLTVGALQGLINVAEIGVIFHQCDPPRRLWDMDVPGTCNLIETCLYIGYAQGGMGALADLFLACYPVYIIGRLQQMRLSVKVGLCLLMSGGVIAGIAGINKTVAISTIAETADQTYAIAKLNTWVLTEMWFILIFGSIPVLRPFFVRFSQSIKTVAGYSGSRSRTHADGDRSGSRPKDETWINLDGQQHSPWIANGPRTKKGVSVGIHGGSEENILSTTYPDQIVVTKKTTVMEESR